MWADIFLNRYIPTCGTIKMIFSGTADRFRMEVWNMKQKLFSRDFTLVVIGQVISLFGNAAIRFALPLYLLNQTGSSALYGTVMACAFIPSVLLSPVGGMIADRVNKRNVMVVLDFFTAGVILAFSLLMDRTNIVLLITIVLMILYGIAGEIGRASCRERVLIQV